jgi:HAD superfamily hydrolase (TIGR01509 family)
VRALIVSGGGFQGLAILELLRADRRTVVTVVDIHEANVTTHLADHYEVVPPLRERDAFAAALLEICRRRRVQVVFPATELELAALAELAPALQAIGAIAAVSPPELVSRLGSKRGLSQFCSENGIPAPRLFEPWEAKGRHPLLLKPDRGWGGREQRVVGSAEELPADMRGFVLQELVEDFEELSVDFALADTGRRSPIGVRARLRVSGGFAVVAETRHDADVVDLAGRVADALAIEGAVGLFNLQVLRDGRGIWVSDLNLRAGTSAAHWADQPDNPAVWFGRETLGLGGEGPDRPVLGVPGTQVVRVLREQRLVGAPDRGVQAVVFDLDDTLLCQRGWAGARLAQLAARLEKDEAARTRWLRRAQRIAEESGLAHIFDHMAAELGWSESDKLATIEAYRACWPDSIEPMPGAVELLEELRERGYRLVLLTDNPPATQARKLRLSGLESSFDAIVYSQEHGAEKPDPAGFLAAVEAAGCKPRRAVMVGDNPYRDAAGAIDAGYRRAFLLVRDEHQRFLPALWRAALGSAAERVAVVRSPPELLRYLPGAWSPTG